MQFAIGKIEFSLRLFDFSLCRYAVLPEILLTSQNSLGLRTGAHRFEIVTLRRDQVGRVQRKEGLPLGHGVAQADVYTGDSTRERRGHIGKACRVGPYSGRDVQVSLNRC